MGLLVFVESVRSRAKCSTGCRCSVAWRTNMLVDMFYVSVHHLGQKMVPRQSSLTPNHTDTCIKHVGSPCEIILRLSLRRDTTDQA